jgi:hypothetical protein
MDHGEILNMYQAGLSVSRIAREVFGVKSGPNNAKVKGILALYGF